METAPATKNTSVELRAGAGGLQLALLRFQAQGTAKGVKVQQQQPGLAVERGEGSRRGARAREERKAANIINIPRMLQLRSVGRCEAPTR